MKKIFLIALSVAIVSLQADVQENKTELAAATVKEKNHLDNLQQQTLGYVERVNQFRKDNVDLYEIVGFGAVGVLAGLRMLIAVPLIGVAAYSLYQDKAKFDQVKNVTNKIIGNLLELTEKPNKPEPNKQEQKTT